MSSKPAVSHTRWRVVKDLACATCGYNLRGLACPGACPECGSALEQMLQPLGDSEKLARDLQRLATSSVLLLIAAMLMFVTVAGAIAGAMELLCMGIAVVAAVPLSAGARVHAGLSLWSSQPLRRVPAIGRRLAMLIGVSAAELLSALACVASALLTMLLAMIARIELPPDLLRALAALTVLLMFASLWISGRFGEAIARRLPCHRARPAFRLQRYATIAIPVAIALVWVLTARAPAWTQYAVGWRGAAILMATMLILTPIATSYAAVVVGLKRLAEACRGQQETLAAIEDAE